MRDDLSCDLAVRRKKLFNNAQWTGIDFVDVADDQRSLCVHFFGPVPEHFDVEHVRIEGGRRIRDIHVVRVEIERSDDPELDDCLHITLDKPGDYSTYRLCLIDPEPPPGPPDSCGENGNKSKDQDKKEPPWPRLDPRYACIDFSFKVGCPSDLDCKANHACPPAPQPTPEINYLAKDYASFRQLILDRLALTLPEWRERHVPDIGITLVEVLAYVADHLSYYQDAVATEAYLDTARRRISVRRHVRLVDYRMHEGCNARAWIALKVSAEHLSVNPKDIYFITRVASFEAAGRRVLNEDELSGLPAGSFEAFEPLLVNDGEQLQWRKAHNELHFHTWGDMECCLPKGSTRATLVDEWEHSATGDLKSKPLANPAERTRKLDLHEGDVLILEEVLGPSTGNPADADPEHRHAVRLTQVVRGEDGLEGIPIVEIEWAEEDALPFALCLSAHLPAPDCALKSNISIARGNVVLVDHGYRTGKESLGKVEAENEFGDCACEDSVIEMLSVPRPFNPTLSKGPLTFAEPLVPGTSASAQLVQNPCEALPQLCLTSQHPAGGEDDGQQWLARYDLLASGPDERHFVVEMDEDGRAQLRFGDSELGRLPQANLSFKASYRIGNGPAGNVGRDTIRHLVLRHLTLNGVEVEPSNPLPAVGGTAAESVAEVKLLAPHAFRTRRERAIVAEDYAELAQRNAKLQRAWAEMRWTGSWYEARVAIDPLEGAQDDPSLAEEIATSLFRYRRMGHEVAVVPAQRVPIELALTICVLPHYTRGEVKAALLDVFSNRRLRDGSLGFFHPDKLSFGDGVHVSRIIAAAVSVAGVETVVVSTLKRAFDPKGAPDDAVMDGVLVMAPNEVAQLDNDPDFPENGKLLLTLRGGR